MNPSVQNSVFQKHTAVVSTRSPVKQESDSLVPGVFCMLSPHLVSQSLQMWAIHQLSTHTPLCVCVCAPVYDEHKDDCHPQSCVWVKKIYIFREVWIRFTSLGRNPRKQPATEISVMKNKNTYLMCQRGTVDPTPGKWKWEDGCKGHRCYLFFFFFIASSFYYTSDWPESSYLFRADLFLNVNSSIRKSDTTFLLKTLLFSISVEFEWLN